jgi:hypothetical protein
MSVRTLVPLALVVASLAACRATPMAHQMELRTVTSLFGPVISSDAIRGRQDDGEAVVLLVSATIVRVDLERRRVTQVAIGVTAGTTCWGLAKLDDGSLWSLRGRNAVIRIEPDGRVSRELPLAESYAGLFAAGNRLLYQKAMSIPPAAALSVALPGEEIRQPWSGMTTRVFPGIARAQVAALNMVACGSSEHAERPCWFPDEAAVSLIRPRGETRRLVLAGLAEVAPEVLLAAENPPRPVRDVFVDRRGRIWVLSSGTAPPGAPERPGGWIVARYAADGAPQGQVRLAEPVRLILRADAERVIVLAGSGHIGEVKAW